MELKKYNFDFNVLDDHGKPQNQRLANDDDVAKLLDGKLTSPSEHLHELTRLEMDKHPSMNYATALSRVQDRNPKLVSLYASEVNGCVRIGS